ncbi:MAG: flagellar export protein FliJ [bacterium]|nr:flagellar export protein FliJ [bacterium]
MANKKFKYRLEPLLNIRKHREKERQKEHAEAEAQVLQQESSLQQMDEHRLGTLDAQRDRLSGTISVAETLVCSRYLVKLKRDRLAGTELLHGLRKEEDERRVRLVEAARQRKIFEMLREKQEKKHLEEIAKADQKELDEVAAVNDRRKKKKGRRKSSPSQ